MKKIVLPLLVFCILFCFAGCQKTLGEPGDMTIRNATVIDTSKVNEIDTLIGDKLVAYRYQSDALFSHEVMNSDASGYNTFSCYDTEFGYIDCKTNKFHKVGETLPISGISVFSSKDHRYIYYVYAELPEGTSYPPTQEEYDKLQEETPTTILQYDVKAKKATRALTIDVPIALYSPMDGQKVFADSVGVTTGDLPEKPLAFLLDFETGDVQLLYDGNKEEEKGWFQARIGNRYIFLPDIHRTETPTVRILDTADLSETTLSLEFPYTEDDGYRNIQTSGDILYLYAYTDNEPYDGLCKYVPTDKGFEKQQADPSELQDTAIYYSQSVKDMTNKNAEQFFTISDTINGTDTYLSIDLEGFTPPPLGHGNMLYPTTGENFILCSGTELFWEWRPIRTLQADYRFYYVTGAEIDRALGNSRK